MLGFFLPPIVSKIFIFIRVEYFFKLLMIPNFEVKYLSIKFIPTMKKIILLLAVAFFTVNAYSQDKAEPNTNPNAPKLEFSTIVLDYGEIAKGGDGVRYFDFVNTGKEPLIISNVKSSCGCTVPEYPKTPIGPGESSQIKVKYNTNRVGPFRKTITIFSNAEGGKNILTVKGKVLAEEKS